MEDLGPRRLPRAPSSASNAPLAPSTASSVRPSALPAAHRESSSAEELISRLREWLAVFSEHYRQEISELSAVGYLRGLADLTATQLEIACGEALRSCRFLPTVGEIRAALAEARLRGIPGPRVERDRDRVAAHECRGTKLAASPSASLGVNSAEGCCVPTTSTGGGRSERGHCAQCGGTGWKSVCASEPGYSWAVACECVRKPVQS